MATEWRKVVVNLHPAEKVRNHCYIYYFLEKKKKLRTGFKNNKNFNNFICQKIQQNISPLKVVKNNNVIIISKVETIFVLYSMSFVFHLYPFIVFYFALEMCEIMHGDYLVWKLYGHPV